MVIRSLAFLPTLSAIASGCIGQAEQEPANGPICALLSGYKKKPLRQIKKAPSDASAKSILDQASNQTLTLDASTRNAGGNLRTHPLRATKVGSWADFIGNFCPFLPKLALHPATMNSAIDWLGPFCCLQLCGKMPWRIQMLLCSAAGPAWRWTDGEFCASSKRLPNARGLREVSAHTGCVTRTQHTAWSVVRPFIWCWLLWATPPLRLPAGICTRIRASRAPSSWWRDEERVWARMG